MTPPSIRVAAPGDLPFLREMLFEAAFWRPGSRRPPLEEALARPDLVKLLAELLRALLAAAHREGVAQLSLSVERDNPALRVYERAGFRTVSASDGAFTMVARTAPEARS